MKPELHKRKWVVDGLCYVIRLSYNYWKLTGDVSHYDQDWQKAMKLIVKTFKEQQRKTNAGPYFFTTRVLQGKELPLHMRGRYGLAYVHYHESPHKQ